MHQIVRGSDVDTVLPLASCATFRFLAIYYGNRKKSGFIQPWSFVLATSSDFP